MTRTAIIAAMPDELKPLVRGWKHSRSNGVDLWRWSFEGGEWIAACAGAGVERAARAFAEVEKCGEVDRVISVGWAGALREELLPGCAYDVSCVIDARTGERFLTQIAGVLVGELPNETQVLRLRCAPLRMTECGGAPLRMTEGGGAPLRMAERWEDKALKGHDFSRAAEAAHQVAALAAEGMHADQRTFPQGLKPIASNEPSCGTTEVVPFHNKIQNESIHELQSELWLVTAAKVADETEKKRLAATYEAGLVEMEAAGIARLARMRGIPFYCIKGISDGYNDKIPDFNRFISEDGQFLLARFVFFALLRPWYWPALIRMGENSKRAARAIAVSVHDLLAERGFGELNGDSNDKGN